MHTTLPALNVKSTLLVLTCASAVFLSGCASKTPYATLSEKVYTQSDVPRRYKLQKLPAPFPYLAVGDVISKAETSEPQGSRTLYVDSFNVVTSPERVIARYSHPDLPDVSKCLLSNFQNELGDTGQEKITVSLDGKMLVSMAGGYKNAAFDTGAKVLKDKAQSLEFVIPLRFQRPDEVEFDRMLAEIQAGTYSPLKKGCTGPASDNNFVQLRERVQSNLKQAQGGLSVGRKFYIVDALVWSDSLTAKIVDSQSTEVGANAKADLAALATGFIGTPNAEVKFADSDKNSVTIEQTRTHWAYRAVPLKADAEGRLVVDRSGAPLLLSPGYRKSPAGT